MKQAYFLFICLAFHCFCFAQKEGGSKIYGYKQKVLSGIVRVDAVGKELPRKLLYNYFIYLASTSQVEPLEIWINGEAFSPIINIVSSSSVEYTNPTVGGIKKETLVPKTNRTVLQLGPSLNTIGVPTSVGRTLAKKNELVVIYKSKDKMYYKKISKLKMLEAVNMQ